MCFETITSRQEKPANFLLCLSSVFVRTVSYFCANTWAIHGDTNIESCAMVRYCGFIRLWPFSPITCHPLPVVPMEMRFL